MVKLALPLRPWVPQWLGILTMFVILLPVIMINGAYTGSMVEVSNTLGILSEDITMGYYAASVGMAVAYPVVPKVLAVVTPKTLLLSNLFLQILLSCLCAASKNIDIIVVCSFFVGFLKAFVLLEFIILIRPVFSLKNVRSEFYSYFYPIVFSGGQISMAITAQLAYYYQWQYMYYFTVLLMLVAMVFVLLFFRYARTPVSFPFWQIDWRSILLAASAQLFCIYVFTYGKSLDWYACKKIWLYTIWIPVLVFLFLHRQRTQGEPYVSLIPLKHLKPVVGYFFMIIVMFLSASGSLVTNYMNSIIRVDSVHSNVLNLFMIPGFVLGGVICFWWFRWQRWRFRFLIAGGLFCYVFYLAILYFGMTPYSTYEMLFFPMFLKGLGMLTLFIAFGVYVVEDLDKRYMLSNAFFLISFRSVLAPVISASFFSNVLYYMQIKSIQLLSENMTLTTPLVMERYSQAFKGALSQGLESGDAGRIATNSLYSVLQQQALLLGIKTIIGYILIGTLILAIVSCFIPFHKTLKVAVVKTGDDMV